MLRYAITTGDAKKSTEGTAASLAESARRWAELEVDYVQLREKGLDAGELVRVAMEMAAALRNCGGKTKLLVNGRADVAVAAGADGVHLTASTGELTAQQVRRVFAAAGSGTAIVSASCHTVEEVERATASGVNVILFGPVFEKRVGGERVVAGVGLEALREACAAAGSVPVLALGGVSEERAGECVAAGAAGVAGIRIFDR